MNLDDNLNEVIENHNTNNLGEKYIKSNKYDFLKFGQDPLSSQNCRNAVTGAYYPFKNGSIDSMRLYCIRDCTGVNYKNELRKDPINCYYDNPEQYESHRKIPLNKNLKDQWYKKQIKLKSNEN